MMQYIASFRKSQAFPRFQEQEARRLPTRPTRSAGIGTPPLPQSALLTQWGKGCSSALAPFGSAVRATFSIMALKA
jgi:hypothetical protein